MSRILQNPLYCIADTEAYEYFSNNTDVQIVNSKSEFDGSHGLMFYNRRKPHNKTTRDRDESKWILVIGDHTGVISGNVFAKAQKKLYSNKNQAPRSGQSIRSPLVGIVKCGRCNASMSVFSSRKSKSSKEKYYSYFRCLTREQKAKVLCDNTNVRADKLEELIVNYIRELFSNEKSIQELLDGANNDLDDKRVPLVAKRNKMQCELDTIDSEINNLTIALGKGTLPETIIRSRYKDLEKQQKEIKKQLLQVANELDYNYQETYSYEKVLNYLKTFNNTYDYMDFDEKKSFFKSIIKEIIVDKNNVKLTLYLLPEQDLDSQSLCLRTDKDSY